MFEDLLQRSPKERLSHAFSHAQESLGVEKLLDPEGMNSNNIVFVFFLEHLQLTSFTVQVSSNAILLL